MNITIANRMMESSGSDKGFFQKPPVLRNQFYDDVSYQRCFRCEQRCRASAPKRITTALALN